MSVSDEDLDRLADQMLGLSGAEVAAVLRDARTQARAAERELTLSDVQSAATAVQPSPDPSLLWRIAIHEAGHMVAGHLLYLPPARSARMTPRGGEILRPHLTSMTERDVRDLMCVVLAGRAAEEVIFADISSGGGGGTSSDLAQATRLAIEFEGCFGFGETLTWIPPDTPLSLLPQAIQQRVEEMLQSANRTVREMLEKERGLVHRAGTALYERCELDTAEIAALLSENTDESDISEEGA